jgi:hypothetical protein
MWKLPHGHASEKRLKRDWLRELDETATLEAVLQLVEDFVGNRSDVYWIGVPQELRRPTLATEQQLQQWHHALVQAISGMSSPGSPMQELAVLSLRAAVRLHQIRQKHESIGPSNDGGLRAAPIPFRKLGR